MRYQLLIFALLAVGLFSCALPVIPEPNTQYSLVKLYTLPGRSLIAQSIDGKNVEDGRYFLVNKGKHQLKVRFQYYKNINNFERFNQQNTCLASFEFNFDTGKRYILEARPAISKGIKLYLKLNQQYLNIIPIHSYCGPF